MVLGPKLMSQTRADSIAGAMTMLDAAYGADPFLINGSRKEYNYQHLEGHPYFLERDYSENLLFLKNRPVSSGLINYDVLNDRVILRKENVYGAVEELLLNNLNLDSFIIANRVFHHLPAEPAGRFYYTRAAKGKNRFVNRYYKELRMDAFSSSGLHYFSDLKALLFYFDGETLVRVNGWRSLKNYFTKEEYKRLRKSEVKDINLNACSDGKLSEVLNTIAEIEKN